MPTADKGMMVRALGKARRISRRAEERLRGLPLRAAERKLGRAIPPGPLIFLIANTEDVSWYLDTGALAARSVRAILAKNGLEIENFASLLDFGCGVGRVIRHWENLPGTQVFGVDYNPKMLRWCEANLPFAKFALNEIDSPLNLESNSLDFIYSLSVFTHLSEAMQRFWIDELARILVPGGHLMITTHGDHYLPMLTPDEQQRYRSGQLVVQKADREGSNDCAAFHPVPYVWDTLAKGYEVVDMIPEGALGNPSQDVYLLRKPLN